MDPQEIEQLVHLLQKLQQHKDGDLLPYPIWYEISMLVPLPAVEIILSKTGKEILLTERHDEHWDGWHIPGGFMLRKESVQDACTRIAQKELGIDVIVDRILDVREWKEHPYGTPLSILCLCHSNDQPNDGDYFTQAPVDLIPVHHQFVGDFLKDMEPNQGDI